MHVNFHAEHVECWENALTMCYLFAGGHPMLRQSRIWPHETQLRAVKAKRLLMHQSIEIHCHYHRVIRTTVFTSCLVVCTSRR